MTGPDPVPARTRLPDRRPSETVPIEAGAAPNTVKAHATVGYDPATGQPREIFLDGKAGIKTGSPMEALLADASAVVSVALQHGVPAVALAHSLARLGSPDNPGAVTDAPGSILGAAIDLLVAEAETATPYLAPALEAAP